MVDKGLRILIVDGQSRLRRMLSRMLSDSGAIAVHQASDLPAAKNIMLNLPVDIVLCDWSSPGLDGMDFLRSVRLADITKFLPFLVMSVTGQLEDDDFAVGKDFDVDGLILKPINQDDLQEKVDSTIKRYDAMKEDITHLSRAGAFIDVEMIGEAREELESIQKKDPALPRIWTDAGLLHESMDSTLEAKSCFQKAISLDRDYARPYEGLGNLLWREGNLDLASQFYESAATISPRNPARQFSFARLLLETGDTDGAHAVVHRALEGKKSVGSRSAAAAEFFLSAGHPEMAEIEYAFAIEMNPNNLKYYNRLGMAYRRQKK
ncbi:MAG: response regulator, partial [bacterium]